MGKKWIKDKKKDYYYRKAKAEKYRSRASYKLKQLNRKFGILRRGYKVLELGSAPGGWTQVAREIVGEEGYILAVDIQEMKPLGYENVEILRGDFTSPEVLKSIVEKARNCDAVISDASPNISGNWDIDQFRSFELCIKVLEIAKIVLKPGGNLVMKIFQGENTRELIRKVRENFRYVKLSKPKASRSRSAEIYLVAKGLYRSESQSV